MPTPTPRKTNATKRDLDQEIAAVLASFRKLGDPGFRERMGSQFAITGPSASTAFGVSVGAVRAAAKQIKKEGRAGRELADALWSVQGDGQHEARMLAAFIDDPALVTPRQMDRWCRDFDNWAICDTVCFHLFDRVDPALAFAKVSEWSKARAEFQRRAAFALLASLALHAKHVGDAIFAEHMPLIEAASGDDRNFVKKAVNWALRAIGSRRPGLRADAIKLAESLAASKTPSARWIGKDALRELKRPAKAPRKKGIKRVPAASRTKA